MSLVGWWKLDGNAEDSSRNRNNGTVEGNPSVENGKIGDCYNFDGSNDYIDTKYREKLGQGAISLWFKYSGDGVLMGMDSSRTSLEISNGNLLGNLYDGSDVHSTSYNGLEKSKWYHAVLIWGSSDGMQLFVDGTLRDSNGYNGSYEFLNRSNFFIGANSDISNNPKKEINATLDDVRLYDRVLSKKEVKQLSQAKVLHYKFDHYRDSVKASGGSTVVERKINGKNYRIHAFENPGSHSLDIISDGEEGKVDVLIVGGGGGGGGSPHGAGGGAGGVIFKEDYDISGKSSINLTVGAGGAGGEGDNGDWNTVRGDNGEDSTFDGLTAIGGGAGGGYQGIDGADGGSGGGATDETQPGNALQPGSADGGYGNGSIQGRVNEYSSGGGGASEAGDTDGDSHGGDGKDFSNTFGTEYGENGVFAGGGGGGVFGATSTGPNGRSPGGNGGGGNGGIEQNDSGSTLNLGQDAMANTGGGGGGSERNDALGSSTDAYGGDGGSGIVLIRYEISETSETLETLDSSGYENHGKISGPNSTYQTKVGSGAYSFNGSGDMIPTELSYNRTDLNAVTVSAWYKSSSSAGQIIASSDRDEYWCLGVGSDEVDGVQWTVASSDMVSTASSSDIQDGNWHHIVAVFDTRFSNDHKIYIDGELDSEASYKNSGIGSGNISYTHIGVGSEASNFDGNTGPNDWMNGSLDDVRIYHTGLSASEVEQLYEQRASIDDHGNMHSHEISEDVDTGLDLEVRSAGTDSSPGPISELKVNGSDIGADARGINVLEIDKRGNKIKTDSFDVYGSPTAETDRLIQYIDDAKDGNPLLFAEYDHAGNITDDGVTRIEELGSDLIQNVQNDGRSSWAFICEKGTGKFAEEFASSGNGPVTVSYIYPQDLSIEPEGIIEGRLNEVGPASDSLIGYWPLDGDARDYSGNGNDGTVNGATITSGLGQSAYSFDGSSSYITTDATLGYSDQSFTASIWFKGPTDGSLSSNNIILGNYIDAGHNGFWWIGGDGSEKVEARIRNSNSSNDTTLGNYNDLYDGNWHHYTFVRDAGSNEIRFYGDGGLLGTASFPGGDAARDNDSFVGMFRHNGNVQISGKAQDARIHNRALAPEEVKILYNLTDPRQDQRVIQGSDGTVYMKGEFSELL